MDAATAERLLELNRGFYDARGRDFSATRIRIQPGVKRLLDTLRGDESMLDLGCGNGELARVLSSMGHRGSYLGLDSSPVLLTDARAATHTFPVSYAEADLADGKWDHAVAKAQAATPAPTAFDVVVCFAVLHHIPGAALRLEILCKVREMLANDGKLMLSNWIFSHSSRMTGRIHPWSAVGMNAVEVDTGDYLVDWRRGGRAFRYVHEFSEPELEELALASGFRIQEAFYSDGADRKSSLYEVWTKAAA